MQAWNEIPEAKLDTPKGIGWVFVLIRIILIVLYVLSLFVIHIFLSFLGMKNACQFVVKLACAGCLKIIGIKLRKTGEAMNYAGAVVANH